LSRALMELTASAFILGLSLASETAVARAGENPIAFNIAQASAPPRVPRREAGARPPYRARSIATGAATLIREAERWLGPGNFTGRPGAWCAWAVSAWLTQTGHRPLASGIAASALTYGPRLAAARIGALAVLSGRRGSASHVGLVRRVEGDNIELISGNWGHRVAIAIVPRRRILAFIGV
jgi:uncharacterized protein (TIGR02594 family)